MLIKVWICPTSMTFINRFWWIISLIWWHWCNREGKFLFCRLFCWKRIFDTKLYFKKSRDENSPDVNNFRRGNNSVSAFNDSYLKKSTENLSQKMGPIKLTKPRPFSPTSMTFINRFWWIISLIWWHWCNREGKFLFCRLFCWRIDWVMK
jgi:hypothetical protein